MNNKSKTILFASLIAAMILPFNMMDVSAATENANTVVIDKTEDPEEFTGDLKSETRQIGNYLLVKHTYSSSGLNLKNVDHIYREEIVPISSNMTQQEIDRAVNNPETVSSHEMTIIHEDDIEQIDRIQSDSETISAHAFQQWNVVEKSTPAVSPVTYHSSIKPVTTTVEDWASKKDSKVYINYDPINLIWRDSVSSSEKLIDKVDAKMKSAGWDDLCVGTDLYVNISGTWKKQDSDYRDMTTALCNQHHVRSWSVNDDLVIGSAHTEKVHIKNLLSKIDIKHISTTGPNTWEYDVPGKLLVGYHFLTGFDTAESEAAGEFKNGCWSVTANSYNLNNSYTREYYVDLLGTRTLNSTATNDGYATEITCS